ncbi:CLUMA_CG012549, isoform A [Clunio marinus]|uniref:CLUMA_CG012549, isoform A n=1 Tax=Clunio marinus TaxID=568069 RepID=A0A1J1IHH5_9DIPT|nr:CLUMA_CG012549, isoform A [Clunio marinus]
MDINALEKLLKSQSMQMEMLLQKQEERHRIEMQELLNAVHHQNVPDLNVQANNSPTRKIKDLADSMVDFTYDPENNGIFETWYARYRSIFTTEANDLSEAMKIRLLLMKFQQSDYQRYADSILPQEPHELTLVETSIKLKKLFGYKETKFSQRHKCFNLTKEDSEDFITYSARVNKQAEKFDIVNCTPNDLKVLLFVSGLKSSKDSLILEKLLNKIDTQYVQIEAAANQAARDAIVKLTLQDLINEAERIICLKKDKSTVSDSATITDVNNVYTDGKKSSNKSKSSTNSSGKSNHFSNANSSKPSSPAGPFYPCRYCGGLHWNKDCDYRDKTCSTCKKEGHKEGYSKKLTRM